jgi:small subunit ribosomal protein S2
MKRKGKLEQVLTGIRGMRKLPSLVFVVDVIKEHIAVSESRRLRLPIGAIVDTNCDPDSVDFPIPGNDDAIKSVVLIAHAVADTIVEAGGNVSLAEVESVAGRSDEAGVAGGPAEEEEAEETEGESAGRRRRVVRHRIVSPGSPA